MKCFALLVAAVCWLGCSTARGDTIPTLTATSATAHWFASEADISIAGPDFTWRFETTRNVPPLEQLFSLHTGDTVCVGCLAIELHSVNTVGPPEYPAGSVTVGGTTYSVTYTGEVLIRSLGSAVLPSTPNPVITLPAVLLDAGLDQACVAPPNPQVFNPCLSQSMLPGFPQYVANVSTAVLGDITLTFSGPDANGFDSLVDAQFNAVPEPLTAALFAMAIVAMLLHCARWQIIRNRSELRHWAENLWR